MAVVFLEKAWSEGTQQRDDHGRFAGTIGGGGGGGAAGAAEEVQYKLRGGDEEDGHLVPDPPLSDKGFWGYSHTDSQAFSGESARIMGIDGYRIPEGEYGPRREMVANEFLGKIASGKETAGEYVYHSRFNRDGKEYKDGQVIELALTATSSERSAAYAFPGNTYDNAKPGGSNPNAATVYRFESSTKVMGYSKATRTQIANGDGKWNEAITAGRFEVVGVGAGPTYGWKQLPSVEVTLRQTAVFDPKVGWRSE